MTNLSAASAYQVYQLLNVHISRTDEEVADAFRKRFPHAYPPLVEMAVPLILAEHHAAQQLVREMRF